jgi:D-glycero-alpha-D-manno-heptose 1-phosphate guanylyltransferase
MIGLILAGGSGTRLQSVVKDKPKPLADVLGRPFIRYLSDFLFKNGFTKLYISCFYLGDQIAEEYKNEIQQGSVQIITEPKKLGTGGAIFYCLEQIKQENPIENNIIVLNGDSFVNFHVLDFVKNHKDNKSLVTIISAMVENTGRYGTLEIKNNKILCFNEKQSIAEYTKIEPINAGIYAINFKLLENFKHLNKNINEFSFETEVLCKLARDKNLDCFMSNAKFLDIGIPSDYAKAGEFLSSQGLA